MSLAIAYFDKQVLVAFFFHVKRERKMSHLNDGLVLLDFLLENCPPLRLRCLIKVQLGLAEMLVHLPIIRKFNSQIISFD